MDEELKKIRSKKIEEMKKKMENTSPVTVTDDGFKETIEGNDLVLVDFWAPWCGPCKMLAPVLDELAQNYAGLLTVAKLNVDENQQTAAEFGVMSIPTMIIFKDGKAVDKVVGAVPKEAIEKKLSEYMN